jgi:hypothetical protein
MSAPARKSSIARAVAITLLKQPQLPLDAVARECNTNLAYVKEIAATYGSHGFGGLSRPWGKTMKALTVMQPYAELIRRGVKRIENRNWPIWKQWGGAVPTPASPAVLLLHAGRGRGWWTDAYGIKPEEIAWGAAVALMEVVGCVDVAEVPRWAQTHGASFDWLPPHPHAYGPCCWILGRVVPLLRPVPMSGRQGIWECEASAINPHAPLCPRHHVPFCGCPEIDEMLIESGAVTALPRKDKL